LFTVTKPSSSDKIEYRIVDDNNSNIKPVATKIFIEDRLILNEDNGIVFESSSTNIAS